MRCSDKIICNCPENFYSDSDFDSDCSGSESYSGCSGSDSGSYSDYLTFRLTPFFSFVIFSITKGVFPLSHKIIHYSQNV